jgi:capsular polysaccharide transport system permease protein
MPTEQRRNEHSDDQAPGSFPNLAPVAQVSPGSSAPEVVRQKTIYVLGERIRLLGVAGSGAYEHYNIKLQNGFLIPAGEAAILELVRRCLPSLRSYHEIGSGLGTLPLMLAHDGFPSVGIERDERRHLTATSILRELSSELPQIESNCRLIGAPFPDAVADLDVSDSMAILTDFVSSQSPKDYVRLCRGLARYSYVVLDLQRFCQKRESRSEQEALVEELGSYGLSPCEEVIDLESQGYYQLFECKAPADHDELPDDAAAKTTDSPLSLHAEAASPTESKELAVATTSTELRLRPPAELRVRDEEAGAAALAGVILPPLPQRARHRRFGGLLGLSALVIIGIPSLLAILYYGFIASDQFITAFQFAVRGPSQAAVRAGGSAGIAGATGAMSPDSFVVTDYINSTQAIADVERDVDLRAMFSKPDVDFMSRLPANPTSEELTAYWARMVSARFDLISGNVSVSVRAFTPQESFKLAQALIATSDDMFRTLNVRAQQDFVRVADENVARAQQQLAESRQALQEFREKSGLVDADKSAQAGAAIIDDLRKQLAGFQAEYAAVQAKAPNSPMLFGLKSQIAALEGQIKKQDHLGSSTVKSVTAETLAKHQSLDLERLSAEKQYTEALALRTQAYLTAQNQQSYLALFVAPTLPQTSLYPNRGRSIAAVVLAAAAAWFVGMLIAYSLRDHLM